MPRSDDTPATSTSWLRIVLVDAALGLVVAMAGLLALLVWRSGLGAALLAVGLAYQVPVYRRYRRWRRLRREAGLD